LFIVDLFCKVSPAIGVGVCIAIALLSVAAWRGGHIEKVSIPGLFEIKFKEPIVFEGNKLFLGVSLFSLIVAIAIGSLQFGKTCERCDGLPGETAWIFGGTLDYSGGFSQGPYLRAENAGVAPAQVAPGMWVILEEPRKTMIMGYDITKLARAMDSPFSGGPVNYTCKLLPKGTRLLIADRQIRGPSPAERHIWYRVRFTPVGG
jgi:hypothetical protein